MKNYKFIYKSDKNQIFGEIKDERLIQYRESKNELLGNIYRAKVIKYIDSMDAFIVNLGLDKDGLLRKKNTISNIKLYDDILVELIKAPKDNKMYELSEKLTLSNSFIVINPYNNNPKNLNNKKYAYFLRSKSVELTEEEIDKEYSKLEAKFESILKEKNKLPSPKLLLEKNLTNDFIYGYDDEIISNDKEIDGVIYKKDFNPKYIKEISLDLEKSKNRKVEVDDINIVIDQLEALTVIDINSVNKHNNLSKEDMSVKVNDIAIKEIAIQLSLRNIKKMVMIDFLRMNNENKKKLVEKFSLTLKEYNIKHKIMGYSNMGLLEIIVF